jgi:hypothetical protein
MLTVLPCLRLAVDDVLWGKARAGAKAIAFFGEKLALARRQSRSFGKSARWREGNRVLLGKARADAEQSAFFWEKARAGAKAIAFFWEKLALARNKARSFGKKLGSAPKK